MGKSLVIKGADFSANGIKENNDITALLSSLFLPCISLTALSTAQGMGSLNTKRCCIYAKTFASLGIDINEYSKIVVSVKQGYDYVFGTGPTPGVDSGWQGWDGETGGQIFSWVTDNQEAVATIDNTTLSMSLNLRYDDNTTEFSENTVLTDIVDSIVLVQ